MSCASLRRADDIRRSSSSRHRSSHANRSGFAVVRCFRLLVAEKRFNLITMNNDWFRSLRTLYNDVVCVDESYDRIGPCVPVLPFGREPLSPSRVKVPHTLSDLVIAATYAVVVALFSATCRFP